jgi:hypothetical integral membrane protein (TIGR02206 family)
MNLLASFQLLGPSHLAVLFLTATLPIILILWVRKQPEVRRTICWSLAAILLLNKAAVLTYACVHNTVPWTQRLPMQLCDWVTFITAAALLIDNRTLRELAYFWGLAGTLQATLTPDLAFDFPEFYFFTFNISHSGIIISVFFIVFSLGLKPTTMSLVRSFLWLQVYLAAALGCNWLLDENYGYLCRKPVNPSLMDYLGEWPWYILSLEMLALAFFVLLWAPFAVCRQLKTQKEPPPAIDK